jgi:hypothetical protein
MGPYVDKTAPEGDGAPEVKLCEMAGVREHSEHFPVELWRNHGRLVIRAYSECGNNATDLDLFDLVVWLSSGPSSHLLVAANKTRLPDGTYPAGNRESS